MTRYAQTVMHATFARELAWLRLLRRARRGVYHAPTGSACSMGRNNCARRLADVDWSMSDREVSCATGCEPSFLLCGVDRSRADRVRVPSRQAGCSGAQLRRYHEAGPGALQCA